MVGKFSIYHQTFAMRFDFKNSNLIPWSIYPLSAVVNSTSCWSTQGSHNQSKSRFDFNFNSSILTISVRKPITLNEIAPIGSLELVLQIKSKMSQAAHLTKDIKKPRRSPEAEQTRKKQKMEPITFS
jgi:hypothetical protein